ncbi:MAG: O-antigen ligase family protein [Desulfovibrio sp.]
MPSGWLFPAEPFVPPGAERPNSAAMTRGIVTAYLLLLALCMAGVFYASWGMDALREHPFLIGWSFGLLGLLSLFVNPLLLFASVLGYLPYYAAGPQVEVGIITFNPYSIGLLLFASIGMLRLFFLSYTLTLNFTDLMLCGLAVVLFQGTLRSSVPVDTGFIAFNFFFLPVLAFYALRVYVTDEDSYRRVVRILILGLVIFAVLAVLSFLQTGERARALDVPPIGTATMMVLSMSLILGSGVVTFRPLRIALTLICLAAMILTFSRVFIIILLVSPFCYILIRRGKTTTLFLTFFVTSLIVTMLLIVYARVLQPDKTIFNREQERSEQRLTNADNWMMSLYGRIGQYSAGLDNFLEHPFFGVGLYRGKKVITQHNFHMEWLEYSGAMGYIFYFLFLISHAVRMKDLAQEDIPIRWQLLANLMVLNNCLFNGIIHGYMPHVVYILMGLTEARATYLLRQKRLAQDEARDNPDPAPVAVAVPLAASASNEEREPARNRISGDELYDRYFGTR